VGFGSAKLLSEEVRKICVEDQKGDRVFENDFGGWDELQKHEGLIKSYALFNSVDKPWEIRGYVRNVNKVVDAIATVLSVDREEVRRVVEEHNKKIVRKVAESVRGTLRIVSLGWLDGATYNLQLSMPRKSVTVSSSLVLQSSSLKKEWWASQEGTTRRLCTAGKLKNTFEIFGDIR